MKQQRVGFGNDARADLNLALIILGSSLFRKKLLSGEDYGAHPLHVGLSNTRSLKKKIVGILHDVVEDSDWTVDDLRAVGFSNEIVDAVDAMTHRPEERYFDSIKRNGHNGIGLDKKLEDLAHNMDSSRNHLLLKEKDVKRVNKYKIAYAYLLSIKKGDTKPGTPVVDFVKDDPKFADQPNALLIAREFSTRERKLGGAFKPASKPAPARKKSFRARTPRPA